MDAQVSLFRYLNQQETSSSETIVYPLAIVAKKNRREYNKQYHQKNKERINSRHIQYYLKNRFKRLNYSKYWRFRNKEKIRIYNKSYHKKYYSNNKLRFKKQCQCGKLMNLKSNYCRDCWKYSKLKYKNLISDNYKKLCFCGCNQEIAYKEHFRRYGIPKYIQGHHARINHPNLNKNLSEETKLKIKLNHKGMKNKKHTIETKLKISKSHLGIHLGNNNPNWRGGLSFLPYSSDFNDTLKEEIKKRDKYLCQKCFNNTKLCIHHIDYNKQNCSDDNLITLCISCNLIVNYNREFWKGYFNNLQENNKSLRLLDIMYSEADGFYSYPHTLFLKKYLNKNYPNLIGTKPKVYVAEFKD